MSLTQSNFSLIDIDDLNALVIEQQPESLHLEFKRELYGCSDRDRKEMLKDISAFANSHGGHLILGISEEGGVAAELMGIQVTDPDKEHLRILSMARDGIEPSITNIKIMTVTLPDSKSIIAIRVPKSLNPPHRIKANNSNRYWIRNPSGAHEATLEELRNLFNMSSSIREQANFFRNERLSWIIEGHGNSPLFGEGRLIMHIIPISAFTLTEQVDLEAALKLKKSFEPVGQSIGYSARFNYDGFICQRGGHQTATHGYTQVFRNGIIEATKSHIVRKNEATKKNVISAHDLEKQIHQSLSSYLRGLYNLEVPPPFIVLITLEGVNGAGYAAVKSSPNDVIDRPILCLPNGFIEDYGDDSLYHQGIKPAFDALWNINDCSESQWYDETGVWVGHT